MCTVVVDKFILVWFAQDFENMRLHYCTNIFLFVNTVMKRLDASFCSPCILVTEIFSTAADWPLDRLPTHWGIA